MDLGRSIVGWAHLGIRVRDLDRSRRFYAQLGFRFVAGPVGPEPAAIFDHPSGVIINLILNAPRGARHNVLMDEPVKHPGFTHMALAVSDLEDAQVELESLGIEITERPVELPGARALFIRDPDGNVIELNESVPIAS